MSRVILLGVVATVIALIQAPAALAQINSAAACENGTADGYACSGVDLAGYLKLPGLQADNWGWTDPETGKEYVLAGTRDGTYFVDISAPESPLLIGRLPTEDRIAASRDIKTFGNYAFVVAALAGNHGLQIFDLTRLRGRTGSGVLPADRVLSNFTFADNIVINESSGFAYVVGADTCAGALTMFDVSDPINSRFVGCYEAPGVIYDAHCVNYEGPDQEHQDKEICVATTGTTISIIDVENKSAPRTLSSPTYPSVQYAAQGWFTEDQRYFLSGDFNDENNLGVNTRTLIWDFNDLDNPMLIGDYRASTQASDGNQYTRSGYVFQANYNSGFRVLDLADVANGNLQELGFFDTYPPNDNAGFRGLTGIYPFFPSGNVAVSDFDEGLFILRPTNITIENPVDYEINASTSGLWFNADQSGHGLVVQIIQTPTGDQALVYWFTYLDGKQAWLGGVGTISGNQAVVPAIITSNGAFPPQFDPQAVSTESWGELTLDFSDDDNVTLGWTTEYPGFNNGTLAMQRLTRLSGESSVSNCQSGTYFNAAENGHGILTEIIPNGDEETIVVTWFVYADGEQVWVQASGPIVNQRATLEALLPVGGDFPPEFNPDTVNFQPWGEIALEFTSADELSLSWSSDLAGFSTNSMTMERLATLSGYACDP